MIDVVRISVVVMSSVWLVLVMKVLFVFVVVLGVVVMVCWVVEVNMVMSMVRFSVELICCDMLINLDVVFVFCGCIFCSVVVVRGMNIVLLLMFMKNSGMVMV